MSVTRILNENRCVVRWTNDLNFRVTCGKCLKLSRGHGLVPSADSRLPDLNGGAMPGLEIFFFVRFACPMARSRVVDGDA